MNGIPFGFGGQVVSASLPEICEGKWWKGSCEPTSVLDTHGSPNGTSTSILSSSLDGSSGGDVSTDTAGGAGAVPGQKWSSIPPPAKDGWPIELVGKYSVPMDELYNVMIESAASMEQPDNAVLQWMASEVDEPLKPQHGVVNANGNRNGGNLSCEDSIDASFSIDPVALGFSGVGMVDSSIAGFVPNAFMGGWESVSKVNHGIPLAINNSPLTRIGLSAGGIFSPPQQPSAAGNLGFYLPEMPLGKRHQVAFGGALAQELFLMQQHQTKLKPGLVYSLGSDDAAQHAVVDLLQASEFMEAQNFPRAREILARLNHHLPSPVGKPFYRAAFYFKEALNNILSGQNGAGKLLPMMYSPGEVALRIGAYKAFWELSPLAQFTSLTCNQALLETVDGNGAIHILDFDIGYGGHWASFMQELMTKMNRGTQSSLKITAFTSVASHDQLELALTHESLSNFAQLLGLSFEFHIIDLESFDPSFLMNLCSSNEVVFVNFPVSTHQFFVPKSLQLLLRFLRQLSPRLVVSVDHACDQTELSFSQHFLHGLQFYSLLFQSLDASNANLYTLRKVESLLLKPKIETMVSSRYQSTEKLLSWKKVFKTANFFPVPFSSYTETQAECLIRRLQSWGFHVEKQQTSLVLLWQRCELASTSVWRC